MKKLLCTVVLVLGVSTSSSAQNKGDVEMGGAIGYNYSTVSSGYLSAESSSGFNAGISADYYFSDTWSIKGKLIYDQKGWDNGFFEDDFGSYSADYSLNYLTIPVMANWHFGHKNNWYLNFGPYIGFLINAEESAKNTDVTNYFNATDFGLAYGVGVKIPVSTKLKIYLEYDAQGGFLDVFKNNDSNRVLGSRGAFNVGLNFLMK
jgi:opacity protein-like surface antigen